MEIEQGQTVLEVAEKIGPGLAKAALTGKVDGDFVDLTYNLEKNCELEIITPKSDDAFHILNHSAAHIWQVQL